MIFRQKEIPEVDFSNIFTRPTQTESKIKQIQSSGFQKSETDVNTRTQEQFFNDVTKIKQQGGFTDDTQAIQETAKYYLGKGVSVPGVNFQELIQPIEEVEEDKNLLQDVGGALKVESKFDIDPKDNETIGGSMKNSLKSLANASRFVANLPGDAIEFTGDIFELVTNPVETAKGIASVTGGIASKIGLIEETEERKAVMDAIGQEISKNFGTTESALETITQNPFDAMTAVFGAAGGAKTVLQKTGKVSPGVIDKLDKLQKMSNPVNALKVEGKLATTPIKSAGKLVSDVGTTLTSKTSGLNPDTLRQLFKNPDLVKPGVLSREGTAQKVVKAIDKRVEDVGELGKEYQKFRTGNIVANGDDLSGVKNYIDDIDIKELTKADSSLLDEATNYINQYTGDITDSNMLSLRGQIDSLKYDVSGNLRKLSGNGNRILTSIRKQIDELAGDKMEGLKELDKKFAPEIKELNQVKSLIFDKSGNLKDNYIQQVSNLLGRGKEIKLDRIKKLVPEIEDEINALRALEDVQFAKGNKVGTYFQTATLGGGLGGAALMADPTLAIATLIITSPTVVSNVVRAAGYSARTVGSITEKIKNGVKLTASEAQIVSKSLQDQVQSNNITQIIE